MAREWPGQVTPVWLKVDVGNFGKRVISETMNILGSAN